MSITSLSAPAETQAGFFSFFDPSAKIAEAQVIKENSQTLPLPEPKMGVIQEKTSYRELAVDDGALTSETGPRGTGTTDFDSGVSDGVTLYVTRSGDTVSAIAKMFGVSVETIYLANDITKGQPLIAGKTLIILPVTGIKYTVKKGDSLKAIAGKYSVDIEDIIFYNDITETTALIPGDELILPNAKVISDSPKTSSKKTSKSSASVKNTNGYFIRPCACTIRTQGRHGSLWYNGVDITSGHIGTPVYAAASGTVIIAKTQGWNGGAGRMIMIQHPNGAKTMYAHLNEVMVTSGQSVKQGEQIGTLGNSGRSTGAHLHFEVSPGFANPIIANAKYGL